MYTHIRIYKEDHEALKQLAKKNNSNIIKTISNIIKLYDDNNISKPKVKVSKPKVKEITTVDKAMSLSEFIKSTNVSAINAKTAYNNYCNNIR